MIQPTQNPQRGPARALLELLTEHPELPSLKWDITYDGILRGHLHGTDVSAAAQAWADMLGYDLWAPIGYRFNNADRAFQTINTRWRDIPLALSFHSDQSASLMALAVAA